MDLRIQMIQRFGTAKLPSGPFLEKGDDSKRHSGFSVDEITLASPTQSSHMASKRQTVPHLREQPCCVSGDLRPSVEASIFVLFNSNASKTARATMVHVGLAHRRCVDPVHGPIGIIGTCPLSLLMMGPFPGRRRPIPFLLFKLSRLQVVHKTAPTLPALL